MSTEQVTLRPAAEERSAPPAAAAPAAPAAGVKPKPKFDQRYVAPLLITAILLGAHLTVGVLESPLKTGLAILVSIILEIVLGKAVYGKVPHLASAYISGISVGILVRSPFFWPYALCAAITIFSKYVIRVKDRHIWNPSNFGIAWMLLTAPEAVASLSIQFDNRIWAMVVIWTLGSVIIARLKRFHICLTFVLSFIGFALLRSVITGHTFLAEVAPITGPMYQLFTFFMITDPKTTVQSKKGQIVVAFLVAAVECVLRLSQNVHAPYYALFIVGPIANVIEMWYQGRKAAGAKP
jgi:enediyne biosynthesis protein E5